MNHLGGVEGLRQKGWTIVTSAALDHCAKVNGLKAEILGSGDNQVLIVEVPIRYSPDESAATRKAMEEEARQKFLSFWEYTLRFFNSLGLRIKATETWFSSSLFAYGKTLFHNGRMLPMSLKRICRMLHATNESYPSYQAQCSGIFAAGEAACECSYTCRLPYSIALFELFVAYRRAKQWTPAHQDGLLSWHKEEPCILSLKDGERSFVADMKNANVKWLEKEPLSFMGINSLFPAILGDYATQPMLAYMTRGFPDRLCLAICALRRYIDANHERMSKSVISALLRAFSPKTKEEVDWSMLAEDPTSINILRPQQPRNILKAGVLEFLNSSYVVNNVVTAIVQLDRDQRTVICDRMAAMTPLLPRFMSTLLDGSPVGIAQSFIHSFEKTSSVQRAARRNVPINISRNLRNLERNLARSERDNYLFFLYCLIKEGQPIPTSDYQYAQTLREKTWGRTDISGVTVAHPLSYTKSYPLDDYNIYPYMYRVSNCKE
ncbi:unnamed protein product [Nippostrongylus brasiliensis]|uniref:RdRp catalytic domain-containing protein n=1 Tax=Nippostrongylus brasiliensis TaxID=27835 RepID=A0A0N4XD23_NIPBR|nr:unnamed protein product [Nippostrongylus brasiliensis]